ncbi:DNA polymerase III subunit gamma/tau [Acinetobacter terrae]|uniref:DNA polymerase III subunit gamma/tau n=1 Tax=Acinetobacter terrae TaxID=2731247 RepID=A0A7Y2RGC9_9GAMM|nr:DNA polymerase III subunit gamma/tau [Acinetobacter terrae]NNH77966.1 DNA polymerase III subunit gamma/tau [Acinetobacter terrae]OAL76903.1 DNA polymerase III subunit gamma/tau [Acinetobacter terrae]
MYQVLARKYRPRNFIELVGQNHVSRALTSALERGRLHHAYLFTGTRGVGKTTIARILAKCLNCETGVTSTPCEVCATCKAVNEGRFIDLIEIDAASRTKVEDTRELLDNVPYAPTQGRFKVYLIDEVHMLSTHSFNALLKTLEEPPEHVKFLFATTDPQKLPITVISRCLQFTLRPLAVDEITEHLTHILQKEEIQAEQDAIWQIAESAQGSLRDALSLTDQAIAYGQGAIQHQDVKEMLGLIDRTIIYDLVLAIHQNQKQRVSELLMQFRQQALDVSLVLDQLISTLHELALLQYLPDLSLKYSAEINKKIMQLSQLISAQDLQLYYQVACKGRADLQLAVTQEQGFEMCVLRLLAFRPLQPNEVLVSAPQQVQQQAAQVAVQALVQNAQPYVEEYQEPAAPVVEIQSVVSAQIHEPSSDDFLDEPMLDVTEPNSTANSDQIVFDPTSEDALFDLDESNDDVNLVADNADQVEASSDDFLFDEIAPLNDAVEAETIKPQDDIVVAVQEEDLFLSQEQMPIESVSEVAAVKVVDEPVLELEQPSLEEKRVAVETVSAQNSGLMPQDILRLTPQQLEGDWTVDKWEYWFRNSTLTPAVQELAQQGVMTGQIDGESLFHIPPKYEQLLTQLQHTLEQALKNEWPNTHFQVKYAEVETTTPYSMQNQRKEKAYARASELLHAEAAVKDILQNFDGEIQNIQLK